MLTRYLGDEVIKQSSPLLTRIPVHVEVHRIPYYDGAETDVQVHVEVPTHTNANTDRYKYTYAYLYLLQYRFPH